MGRILRIGVDTLTNYSFEETSAYDEDAPAATTSPWPDSNAMDQPFNTPSPVTVAAQGVLVTFDRTPEAFNGGMVKIEPTYDTSTDEAPFIELWTHDSSTSDWTRRRRISLTNLFVGVESGTRKVMDMTFFSFLQNVDMVWLTMDPGAVGAPTMEWIAIQLFGYCKQMLQEDDPGSGEDVCNPDSEFYTGFDEDDKPCDPAIIYNICDPNNPDYSGYDESNNPCIDVDLCNPASVEQYIDSLNGVPGATEAFMSWYQTNLDSIARTCAGINVGGDPPTPAPPLPVPPVFPQLDLCSQDSIDAFRASVAGDADALALFDAFIDGLTADGYFTINCAPPDPEPVYVDPTSQRPAADPDTDGNTPFGSGPGGQAPADGPGGGEESGGGSENRIIERTFRFILTWSGNDTADAVTLTDSLIAPLPPDSLTEERFTNTGNWGPDLGTPTVGVGFTPAVYNIKIPMSGLPNSCHLGVRARVFRLRGADDLRFSISDAGIDTAPAAGFCPAQPDWLLTTSPSPAFTASVVPFIGDNYLEYDFQGGGLSNSALITLALPRETPSQNDGAACIAGFKARSRLGFQRAGCLVGFVVKERDRWLYDVSGDDYDASTVFDYIHRRPYCVVLDVTARVSSLVAAAPGFDVAHFFVGIADAVGVAGDSDAQPTETCP